VRRRLNGQELGSWLRRTAHSTLSPGELGHGPALERESMRTAVERHDRADRMCGGMPSNA